MEFDLESKLLAVLEQRARSRSASPFAKAGTELIVMPQVSVGQIIPDLVVIRSVSTGGRKGREIRLTGFESWIVGELMTMGALAETTLTYRLFTREETTRAALAKLEKIGVVRRTEEATYVLTTDISTRFEIVSVEAKLTKWREAIEQAKAYLRFSDETFIALPASVIDRNTKIYDRCASEGVGLLAVTKTAIRVVLAPRATANPDPAEKTWVLAKLGALHVSTVQA